MSIKASRHSHAIRQGIFSFLFLSAQCVAQAAETQFDRDLTRLQGEYERAIKAANDPVNRRHRESLQQLLDKATQAKDLDSALRIRQALSRVPVAQSVATVVPRKDGENFKTKEEFEKRFGNVTWEWRVPRQSTGQDVAFSRDGFIRSVGNSVSYAEWSFSNGSLRIKDTEATISPDGTVIHFSIGGKPRSLVRVDKP